ncbi:MAG: choice-of-anchor I family protein [Endozoicomonas sp.]
MKRSFSKGLLKFSPALLAISIGSALLVGCNSNSDESPETKTGQFIDAAVSGISYRTETLSGTTGPNGEYDYEEGETVIFSIGGLDFPPVTATGVVTPLDWSETRNVHDPIVTNIARLLQSLDQDKTDEVLTIDDDSITAIGDLDLSQDEWSDSASFGQLLTVDVDDAIEHLEGSLKAIDGYEEPPTLTLIGRFNEGQQLDESMAEIVAFHKNSNSILVINANSKTVDILNASNLTSNELSSPLSASNLTRRSQLNVASDVDGEGFTSGGINSVAMHGNLMAVAVENDNKQANGVIAFYTLDDQGEATFSKTVAAGALPDNVQITPDGMWVVAANEGEPSGDYSSDPDGSVTVIAITDGVPADSATQVTFTDFNEGGDRAGELPDNVRISHPDASVAQDLEPEYVTFSGDSSKAYVSMQENNAIAVIDLSADTVTVERIFGLGYKDHSVTGNGLDASNKDDTINIRTWPNLRGLYMPDTIAGFSKDGVNYVLTANEGDSREYTYDADEATCDTAGHDFDDEDGCFSWVDEKRAGKLDLNPEVFTDENIQENENLGRLKVITTQGKTDDEYDVLYSFGARSFSIFNADSGELVFDSGDDFEQITANILGEDGFNSTDDENDFDDRSDDKGPEPEALAVGTVDGKDYAFIGLERTGGIMMYEITNPAAPKFVQYTINRDFSIDIEDNLADAGDLAPEGMKFVAAEDSPTGNALLIVGNEVSGTTTVYEVAKLEEDDQTDSSGEQSGSEQSEEGSSTEVEAAPEVENSPNESDQVEANPEASS